jgi:hypothetical protein
MASRPDLGRCGSSLTSAPCDRTEFADLLAPVLLVFPILLAVSLISELCPDAERIGSEIL